MRGSESDAEWRVERLNEEYGCFVCTRTKPYSGGRSDGSGRSSGSNIIRSNGTYIILYTGERDPAGSSVAAARI